MNWASEIKTLEHATLKVPYEVLNKKFRTAQKILDREATYVAQAGQEIEKLLADLPPISISPNEDSSGSLSLLNMEGVAVAETGKSEVRPEDENMSNTEEPSRESVTLQTANSDDSCSTENLPVVESSSAENSTHRPKGKDVAKLLGVLVERLGSLKRKAGESIQDELDAARAVKFRVGHLKTVIVQPEAEGSQASRNCSADKDKQWKRIRLNRMLVDHLLRDGMYDTAKMLAEDLGIKELTNVDVFWAAKEVEESLKRHETTRMVAWCYENKSKLRKIRSTLELEIRVQEFVELVRCGKREEAVNHARKYLADSEPEHINAVKKCMGLLAFPTSTTLTPYAELLSPERWKHLVAHFRLEHARLYQLSSTSVLGAVVQAGLASLKTPQCYRSTTKNPNCPVCTEPLSSLANNLPFAHCAHSQLVCAISGEPLNENNPPLVLPSGYVYGTRSLQEMARTNSGKVICPRTSKVFSFAEADKVYVM